MPDNEFSVEVRTGTTGSNPIDVVVEAIGTASQSIHATVYKVKPPRLFDALRRKAIEGKEISILLNESVPSKVKSAVRDRTGGLQKFGAAVKDLLPETATVALDKEVAKRKKRAQRKHERQRAKALRAAKTWVDLDLLDTVEVKEWTQGKLHAKLLIIDGARVLTGSYNWSNSAGGDNAELMLEFTAPRYVSAFRTRFLELWTSDHAEHLQAHSWLYEEPEA